MTTAYYAHSMRTYGGIKETLERQCIENTHRCKVIDPNSRLPNNDTWLKVAQDLIVRCDVLIFSEYQGYVGKGVATEVSYALSIDKPVCLLRDRKLYPISAKDMDILDIDWAVQFARIHLETDGSTCKDFVLCMP